MGLDSLYSSFRRFASRTADRVNHGTDIATLQVKIGMAEKKLEDAFTFLGKAAYTHFTSDADATDRISAAVANVEHIKHEIAALEAQIADARRRAEEKRAEWEKEDAERARAREEMQAAENREETQTAENREGAPQEATPAEETLTEEKKTEPTAPPAASRKTPAPPDSYSTGADAVEVEIETAP